VVGDITRKITEYQLTWNNQLGDQPDGCRLHTFYILPLCGDWTGLGWAGLGRSRLAFTHFRVGATNGNGRLLMVGDLSHSAVEIRTGGMDSILLGLLWSCLPWLAMGICVGGYIAMLNLLIRNFYYTRGG